MPNLPGKPERVFQMTLFVTFPIYRSSRLTD